MAHSDPRVARCEAAAAELADALEAAGDVPPIVLLPALITVFRDKGITLESMGLAGMLPGVAQ